jgi:hypothetical protein
MVYELNIRYMVVNNIIMFPDSRCEEALELYVASIDFEMSREAAE